MQDLIMRRGFRKLHRSDGIWQYKVGRQYVVIFSPDGFKIQATCSEVSGIDDWDRARHKGYAVLRPSRISIWLDERLRNELSTVRR